MTKHDDDKSRNKAKKNLRRLSTLVTAQTMWNLNRLAEISGYKEVGRVVDKLVREKMMYLKGVSDYGGKEKG